MKIHCLYDELVSPFKKIKHSNIESHETIGMVISGHSALVEYRDLYLFGLLKFYVADGGGQTSYLVANVSRFNRTVKFHQLVCLAPDGYEVDHINGNGLDNRRSNLRIVTHQQNQNNQPKRIGSSSQFYGVSKNGERGGWQAGVSYGGKRKNLGLFKSEIEAAVAYNNFLINNGLSEKKRMNHI